MEIRQPRTALMYAANMMIDMIYISRLGFFRKYVIVYAKLRNDFKPHNLERSFLVKKLGNKRGLKAVPESMFVLCQRPNGRPYFTLVSLQTDFVKLHIAAFRVMPDVNKTFVSVTSITIAPDRYVQRGNVYTSLSVKINAEGRTGTRGASEAFSSSSKETTTSDSVHRSKLYI
ncbi:hypothetical protein EAG_04264 [Camponotus floridanus]|uniref:Uncharacterized protein n=1 Tax=Camponotus floridanus TaxID=104421 RepID=E1ZX28_CAMFO|nr:hypothetical protein EAG_04264 [Camponotus floridanus]